MVEGWAVFESDSRGTEIERDDEADVFKDDNEAVLYVQDKAISGSALHSRALVYVDQAQGRKS